MLAAVYRSHTSVINDAASFCRVDLFLLLRVSVSSALISDLLTEASFAFSACLQPFAVASEPPGCPPGGVRQGRRPVDVQF